MRLTRRFCYKLRFCCLFGILRETATPSHGTGVVSILRYVKTIQPNRFQSGVAINWCQIIGLHRDPDATKVNPLVSPQRRKMWRRLWASCLFRDRWLSLTLGRPLRIRLSDCDMPFPTSEDVLSELETLPHELRDLYIPKDLKVMVEHWVVLIKLSKILGEILSLFYQQLGQRPTLLQFDTLEAELNNCVIPDTCDNDRGALATFSYYHLQMHLQ